MWLITPMIGVLLATALGLAIGCEREFFGKSAGIRTNTLVAMGAALFTEVSRFGFFAGVDGTGAGDTARIAAQIVTGVGFLGAGLIFVRKDVVRGLTTAAVIWFAAGVGMAAGAELYLVAVCATALYLLVMVGIRPLEARLPRSRSTLRAFEITYADGQGVLREIIHKAGQMSINVIDFEILGVRDVRGHPAQAIQMTASGASASLECFAGDLTELSGVYSVIAQGADAG